MALLKADGCACAVSPVSNLYQREVANLNLPGQVAWPEAQQVRVLHKIDLKQNLLGPRRADNLHDVT